MAYLLQFGFDMGEPMEVRIEYAELIRNDFKPLDVVFLVADVLTSFANAAETVC